MSPQDHSRPRLHTFGDSLSTLESVCFSRTLLVGNRAPDFAVIDLGTGELVRWVGAEGSVGGVEVIAFSPDGTRVVTVERTFEPTRLCSFDSATWSLQWSAEGFLEGDPAWVSFSRDGQRVIFPTITENFWGLLRTYDARTGVLLEEARGYEKPVFLSDGTVAQVSFRQIEILREGKVERTVDIPTTALCGTWELVISPDEKWATFARAPSPLLLLELSTG
jgi:WD40 repeat protein